MGEIIGELTQTILGPLANPLSDLMAVGFGDRMANWRLRNVMRAHAKLQEEAERHGLVLRADKIPDRFSFSWFEQVSRQDDDNVQAMFAKLMAKAAAGVCDADERYVRMLGGLSAKDVFVFSSLYSEPAEGAKPPFRLRQVPGHRRDGMPRNAMVATIDGIYANYGDACVEVLSQSLCVREITQVGKTGFVPGVNFSKPDRIDIDRAIKQRTNPIEIVTLTALGEALALATLDKVRKPIRSGLTVKPAV